MADATLVRDEFWEPTEAAWLKFEEHLGISGSSLPQLSYSSGTPKLENLYVLTCYFSATGTGSSGYSVYHIDVNSASDSTPESLEPILGWAWHDNLHDAFVICGSKLYMFGGVGDGLRWTDSMSTYDMGRALSSSKTTTYLDEESVVTGPKMQGRKCQPVAVVIGDSKICVFGKVLHREDLHQGLMEHPYFSPPFFEVFDTKEDTWKSLPEPMSYADHEFVRIESYCVHQSCLIIQTSQGIYGINVDNTVPEWVKLDGSERFLGFPLEGMWTMVDKKLCGPFNVKKQGDPQFYQFAPKALTDTESLIKRYPNGVLCRGGVDDRCINLCIVRTGFSDVSDIPNLLVDIMKLDDEARKKFGCDLSKWQEIESHKSFCFSLRSCPCDHMEVIACFPTKDALESHAHSNKRFASSHRVGTKACLESPTDEEIIQGVMSMEDDENQDPDDSNSIPHVSPKEAFLAAETLKNYLLQNEKNVSNVVYALQKVKDEIEFFPHEKKKQLTIDTYFRKV